MKGSCRARDLGLNLRTGEPDSTGFPGWVHVQLGRRKAVPEAGSRIGDDEVDRAAKEQLVTSLNQTFNEAGLIVVTHYSGLTVGDLTDLRRQMRDAGASFKVTKNRLTRLALAGTKYEPLTDMFTGPTGIAVSPDPIAAAKVSVDFAKKNEKLIVLGGAMGGNVLDADGIKALASLPSLDALRGKIVGLLNAPAGKLVGVLQAPAGQMARVIGAYAAKGEAA